MLISNQILNSCFNLISILVETCLRVKATTWIYISSEKFRYIIKKLLKV